MAAVAVATLAQVSPIAHKQEANDIWKSLGWCIALPLYLNMYVSIFVSFAVQKQMYRFSSLRSQKHILKSKLYKWKYLLWFGIHCESFRVLKLQILHRRRGGGGKGRMLRERVHCVRRAYRAKSYNVCVCVSLMSIREKKHNLQLQSKLNRILNQISL